MSGLVEEITPPGGSRSWRDAALQRWLWCCLCLLLLGMPGCSGCNRQSANQKKAESLEEKRKRKEPNKDFTIGQLVTQPTDATLRANLVKPGHFVTAKLEAKANNFDFQAELETATVDRNGNPLRVPGTNFKIVMSRPAALPKGQQKGFETTYFIPPVAGAQSRSAWLENRLVAAKGGRQISSRPEPTTQMPGYQYFMVVLANNPDAYGYLKQLHSVTPPYDELSVDEAISYYRVILPDVGNSLEIPAHPFAWTTIGVVVWDQMDPSLLNQLQQKALLDWLHWGGQLIVSGPGSVEALEGSFLAPYLPAARIETRNLAEEDVEPLNAFWSVSEQKSGQAAALRISPDRALVSLRLRLNEGASWINNTAELVAERRVGRGRVVLTSFPLTDRDVVNWGSFDSFFNSAFLRRPPRRFSRDSELGSTKAEFVDLDSQRFDARLTSLTRYFARDIGPWVESSDADIDDLDWHFDGHQSSTTSGVGGWTDGSGAAKVADASLSDAAGIEIPKADFVLKVLAVYLVVLVPVNWAFFRILRRLEWAWISALIIAVVGAYAVIRLAQLDIGFVRSRTEICVLEVHNGYNRGHLTRYSAIYSSLATPYTLAFDDPSAIARPTATLTNPKQLSAPVGIRLVRDDQVRLEGLQVDSSSTRKVHIEQMYELGGSLQLSGSTPDDFELYNSTQHSFEDAGLIWRDGQGVVRVAWLGKLASGTSVRPQFSALPPQREAWFENWNRLLAPQDSQPEAEGDIESHLGRLFQLATRRLRLREGDARLVAWTREDMRGTEFFPKSSQTNIRTVLVAHLRMGELPAMLPDTNLAVDFRRPDDEEKPEDALNILPDEAQP